MFHRNTEDPEEYCKWYEKQMKLRWYDLQVWELRDGHIAFNEPGSSFASRTRVKALHKQTLEDNFVFPHR